MKQRLLLLTILLVLAWSVFTAVLFAMWWSVAFGVAAAGLAVALRERPLAVIAVTAVATPLVLAQVALPEFASGLDEIACRVRAAHADEAPSCRSTDVDPAATGPLLSTRQHLAIRWLNLHMAAGGWLMGYEEVAWETIQLDLQSTAEHREAVLAKPIRKRRRMCKDGAADGGPLLERTSDFAMDAAITAKTAEKLKRRTRAGQHRWLRLPFPGSYARHPWHVVLALWVPDSTLHARRNGDELQMWWEGDLHYPLYVIKSVRLSRLWGSSYELTMDEAVFCGLQMDGVWRPFRMKWHWTLDSDAPQLQRPADERRLFERIARKVL